VNEEVFGHHSGGELFLGGDAHSALGSHLHVAAFDLLVLAVTSCFDTLSLHKLRFLQLFEFSLVATEFLLLVIFDHLNSSMLKAFSNQNLEDGLGFQVEIEQVEVLVDDLNFLVLSFSVRNENSIRGSVDIIVRLNVKLVHHVLGVAELSHDFVTLLLLHHVGLLLLLHLVLLILVNGHLLLPSHLLLLFKLLLFDLLVADHLHLPASLVLFDPLLLLHNHGVRLHVDGDD